MKKQRRLVKQPLGRFNIFDHDAACQRMQLRILIRAEFPAGKHDNREILEFGRVTQLLKNFESSHIGETKIEHHAIVIACFQRLQRVGAGVRHINVDVFVPEKFSDAELLGWIVLDHQKPFAPRLRDTREFGSAPNRGLRSLMAW